MASGWGSSVFGGRKPGAPKPTAADAPAGTSRGPSTGSAPAAGPAAGAGGGPAPRRGPLPSLRELGAFDDDAPATPRPRISGRLTDDDLRGAPARPAARPLHGQTPFETVRTPEGVQLKSDVDRRAALAALAAREAARRKTQPDASPAGPPQGARPGAPAQPPTPPPPARPAVVPPQTPAAPGAAPLPDLPDPLVDDGLGASGAATGKTVPGVTIGWSDLNAAVEAGWMRPEAAHAIWARWLARKPITRIEDDGTPMPPAPSSPAAPEPPIEAAPEPASETATVAPAQPPAAAAQPDQGPVAATAGTPAAPTDRQPDRSPDRSPDRPPEQPPDRAPEPVAGKAAAKPEPAAMPRLEADPGQNPEDWPDIPFEPPQDAGPGPGAGDADADDPAEARAPRQRPPPPDFVDAEVLEPLEDANARRAAERAAQAKPTIEVTDVIEVPSLQPAAHRPDTGRGTGWAVGQFALALMAALAAALCVGLGSTLFGPWGACAAALGWTAATWRLTGRWQRQAQPLRALLGAHLVLPLTALTVWQFQVAMDWWPPASPVDLFADTPLATASRIAPAMQLDWRWLALAGMPLLAALTWLLRLRHPLLLGSVTVLLWMVAFQAVAGVLQALGLAFHGMTTFMLLLGGLTLGAGIYIEVKARAAGLADYARWVYLAGMLLLGVGWVSLAPLPMPVPPLRYAGLVMVAMLALALARPALVALVLAFAGFDLAWTLRQSSGSDLLGLGTWVATLAATAGLTLWLKPRLPRLAAALRAWMPASWRRALDPGVSGPRHAGTAAPSPARASPRPGSSRGGTAPPAAGRSSPRR